MGGKRLEAFPGKMLGMAVDAAAVCLDWRRCRRAVMSMPSFPSLEWPNAEGDDASGSVKPPPISLRDPDECVSWERVHGKKRQGLGKTSKFKVWIINKLC